MSPFLAVFLDNRGLSSLEIGEIIAVVTATKVIGPTLWAMLSDRTGKQLPIIRLGAGLSLLSFVFLFWFDSYWFMLTFLALFSLFWTAILPQLEVMTLTSIRRSPKIYARIRLWGSLGFIVAAVIASELIARFGAESYLLIGLLISLGLAASTMILKQPRHQASKLGNQGSIFGKVFTYRFVLFFLAGVMLQVSFGPYYGFFALYLDDYGYQGYTVGLLVGLGSFAEIGVFLIAGRLFRRFSIKQLLVFSMLSAVLRWSLTAAYTDLPSVLVFSQLLHAFSFGIYHSASIQFLHLHFAADQQNRGQAIYIAGVYGVGGALGVYATGAIWFDGAGGQNAFYLAAVAALIGAILALFLPSIHRKTVA